LQTFLPYESFQESAKCLDYRRLGKQRVEAYQIIRILTNSTKSNAWKNHPAVLMWRGYVPYLIKYYDTIVKEWVSRGYKNNMPYLGCSNPQYYIALKPSWLGDKRFHDSHKANLMRKNALYYSQYKDFWGLDPNMPYYWPTNPRKYNEWEQNNNRFSPITIN